MTRGFQIINDEQLNKDFHLFYIDHLSFKEPTRGTKLSAGYDIFAPFEIVLEPDNEITVPTGYKAYMQPSEFLMIIPRSGLGFKYYTRLANTCGVIDSDYYSNENNDGHIWVKIRNEGRKTLTIKQGEAFCQAIFMPFLLADGDSFESGDDRVGGFGSTGK